METEQPTRPASRLAEYCTISAAAVRLGVRKSTVWRWAEAGRLNIYRPRHAPGERANGLLLCSEVDDFAAARQRVRGG